MNDLLKPGILYSLVIIIAACSPTQTPAPTATPYVFPTFAFNPPTEAPNVATAAAGSLTSDNTADALDPVAVERGKGRWDVLECAACHGENGQGGADGPSLIEMTLSEEDFIDFLRTGGTMGNEHQFATDRLSRVGITNLYQYVLSLQTQ